MAEKKEKKKYRIGILGIAIWVLFSTFASLLTLIPFAGDIVAPIYFTVFAFYLWKTGHGVLNPKIFASEAISLVAELVPVVQELPTILVATVIVIAISRTEDKTGLSLQPGKVGIRLPSKVPPLNNGGKREPVKDMAV